MAPDLSFEEKVDYIYKELKWQKRTRFLNFVFKISILAILIFWVLNINKWLENKAVMDKISSIVWDIIKPIVTDLINNVDINTDKNILIPSNTQSWEIITNSEKKW